MRHPALAEYPMAASAFSVQPQLAQASARRGATAAASIINSNRAAHARKWGVQLRASGRESPYPVVNKVMVSHLKKREQERRAKNRH